MKFDKTASVPSAASNNLLYHPSAHNLLSSNVRLEHVTKIKNM